MPSEVFADETMAHGLAMVAAAVECAKLDASRKALRGLFNKNQLRLHFKTESDAVRRKALDVIVPLGVTVVVYDATAMRNGEHARAACLEAMLTDVVKCRHRRLVVELDDSHRVFDLRVLQKHDHKLGSLPGTSYVHMRASEEPLLCIPDAIAWCWARGGEWRRRVEPLIVETRLV